MSLRTKLILITTAVVSVLFGVSEWLSYEQTSALLNQHEAILMETADHTVALEKLKATRERMFVSTTMMRVIHAVGTLIIAVAFLNYIWFRVIYRPIERLLSQINIMARGTWTAELPVNRDDEIGQLTKAFNGLGRELTMTFEYINASSKLSALALIGNRVIRAITTVRGQLAAVARNLQSCKGSGIGGATSTLAAVEAQLASLETQFESEFDRELLAMSTDRRVGAAANSPSGTVATLGVLSSPRAQQ
jgi:HAMP domain-containing protein